MTLAVPSATLVTSVTRVTAGQPPWLPTLPTPCILAQLNTPITVILGNPPYSAGQTSANDNNANVRYPTLDNRIAQTYAAKSTATLKNSLYDSYVRAIRWATDRLRAQGVLVFVTNGGWIDGNTADGIRLTLADEFTALY